MAKLLTLKNWHNHIITRLAFLAVFTLTLTTPALAKVGSPCCTAPYVYNASNNNCTLGASNLPKPLECVSATETCENNVCQTKTDPSGKTNTGKAPSTTNNSGPSIDPTGTCKNGIDSALGCIPFETNSFTLALLRFIVGIAGGIAIILMIIGTITIMTGGNNPEQVKKGKEIFTGAILGLLFIIFSAAFLRIIGQDVIKLPEFSAQ